jgi:uncharacterized membrane protein
MRLVQVNSFVMVTLAASILLTAFGQVALKIGVTRANLSIQNLLTFRFLTQPFILLGGILYVTALVAWLLTLAKAELSYVYPLLGLSYVASSILAVLFLHEEVTFLRWTGIMLIVIGVIVLAVS